MVGNQQGVTRTDEEQKRANEIYDNYRDELLKRQLSNSEAYDRAILTLSSSALAVSLAFFRFVSPVEHASCLWLLKLSWLGFLVAVVLTLLAFSVGNKALEKQLLIAEKYYVGGDASAFNAKTLESSANGYLNKTVGVVFALALTALVTFFLVNVPQEIDKMAENKSSGQSVNVNVNLRESAPIPSLQRLPNGVDISINSAPVPTMQAVPAPSASSPQTGQQAGAQQSNSQGPTSVPRSE